MDGKKSFLDSFKGFVDYSVTFKRVPPMWMTVGIVIWIGTFISVCPQVILLIRKRSSYGLNIITVIITSFGQFLMVIHYWCLHTADFVGLLQVSPRKSFARMLTFCNMITLWMSYLAVPFCCIIFMDFEERRNRSRAKIAKLWITNIVLVLVLIGSFFAMFIVYCLVGATRGFSSGVQERIGHIYGTIAALLVTAQYLPQIVTTCRVKGSGSLSVLMLAIQAPGGLANAMFMRFGQHEHWTTWVSFLMAALEQFILLFICLFFDCSRQFSLPVKPESGSGVSMASNLLKAQTDEKIREEHPTAAYTERCV